MFRRLMLTAAIFSAFAVEIPEADAAGRRGVFRRARTTQSSRYRSQSSRSYYRQPSHLRHSRSAILDGFFGPYPGVTGYDRSWYVGK